MKMTSRLSTRHRPEEARGRPILLRCRGRQHVDRISDACRLRQQLSQPAMCFVSEGSLQSLASHASAARMRWPSGVGQHRDPRARGHRLVRQQRSDVEELLDRAAFGSHRPDGRVRR